jgi:hypothetical protein
MGNGTVMDGLTLFGLLAVTAMLVFYALEDRSHWYVLAFAGACALASLYGFLQGAWPFGVIEAIWAASPSIAGHAENQTDLPHSSRDNEDNRARLPLR